VIDSTLRDKNCAASPPSKARSAADCRAAIRIQTARAGGRTRVAGMRQKNSARLPFRLTWRCHSVADTTTAATRAMVRDRLRATGLRLLDQLAEPGFGLYNCPFVCRHWFGPPERALDGYIAAVALQPYPPQPQRIADHADDDSAMAAAADHGRQQDTEYRIEHAGGDRHAGGVVAEGEEQVLPNVAHHGFRQRARAHDAARSPLIKVTPALSIAHRYRCPWRCRHRPLRAPVHR